MTYITVITTFKLLNPRTLAEFEGIVDDYSIKESVLVGTACRVRLASHKFHHDLFGLTARPCFTQGTWSFEFFVSENKKKIKMIETFKDEAAEEAHTTLFEKLVHVDTHISRMLELAEVRQNHQIRMCFRFFVLTSPTRRIKDDQSRVETFAPKCTSHTCLSLQNATGA